MNGQEGKRANCLIFLSSLSTSDVQWNDSKRSKRPGGVGKDIARAEVVRGCMLCRIGSGISSKNI